MSFDQWKKGRAGRYDDDSDSDDERGARGFARSPYQRSNEYDCYGREIDSERLSYDRRYADSREARGARQDGYQYKPAEHRIGSAMSVKKIPLPGLNAGLGNLAINDDTPLSRREMKNGKPKARPSAKQMESKLVAFPAKSAKQRMSSAQRVPAGSSNNRLLVAAIDFGTTYSGYAFSFRHEYDTNPSKMHANEWRNVAQGNMNAKTPTCLLLQPDMKLHSFGNEAKTKYASLCEENAHRTWFFFWEFKMTLHHEKEITQNYQLKDINGKLLDALTVFSLSIRALKDHLMTVLQNGYAGVRTNDVTWVITVPAIWNDSAKKFMRLAAEKAGLDKNNIEIALEPEAASIFCKLLPITRDPETETGMTIFPPGARYMILDCGGGTVDITVHEVLEDNTLKELHKATGGNWGGTVVNKSFLNFISNLVGPGVFNDFSKTHKSGYLELLEEFENKKRMTAADSTERVTIRIPIGLQEMLQNEKVKQKLQQGKYANKVDIYGDKLRMDAALFREFFQQAVDDIIKHTHDLMESLPRPVKAILMVGGFSESPVLQKAVKEAFGHMVKVIVPIEASLCVMKGAVLYGHRPSSISARKSRYTYGVAMTVPYIKGTHPSNRKYEDDGKKWCDGAFDKHVEIGQTVTPGEVQATRTYYPMSTSDKFLPVILYRSSAANPMFVDERSCDFVGFYFVKRQPGVGETTKQDAVRVRLVFGNSDIRVEAIKSDGIVHTADFRIE
ncbi:heat shock 70 kDa protein 12A-like [Ruditapes philippinarum]|uniref:heat shock 70 kDa protein 12A-like n=1 Tax=Ruditapes philippinarum TaxID=129788 RepID=UPI00295AC4FE|nr:heat shock 70 kDa protein 12A-like [Ruditapes philippinarum]